MKKSGDLLRQLGHRIRALRDERKATAGEMARRSRLSLRRYHSLEAGEANISLLRLASVAEALGVTLPSLLEAQAPKVIALLGLRGAGKSTIGPRLARMLKCPFIELDDRIERAANLTVAEIFNLHGEPYYRRMESETLRSVLARKRRCVVAMPGGIVRNEPAMAAIRAACLTVWLKAKPEDHMKRVQRQGDRRPMAGRSDAMGELRRILREREPLYRSADLTVNTSRLSVSRSTSSIVHSLQR